MFLIRVEIIDTISLYLQTINTKPAIPNIIGMKDLIIVTVLTSTLNY